MYVVIVSFTARDGMINEVVSALAANAKASIAEPGCLDFAVLRDTESEGAFVLYERYRDESAFIDEHRATAHYARWKSVERRCVLTAGRQLRTFVPIDTEAP
jgi:autoinducer 2-degrading protein